MRILGIDPGIEKVGYAFFDKKRGSEFTYLASGLIKTSRHMKHSSRLQQIYEELQLLIKQYQPQILVMEQLFFAKNVTTAVSVAQGQGVIILLAAQRQLEFKWLTPLQIKQIITGDGRADKIAVHKMIDLQLGKKMQVKDDDESDAIACAMAYCCINPDLISLQQ